MPNGDLTDEVNTLTDLQTQLENLADSLGGGGPRSVASQPRPSGGPCPPPLGTGGKNDSILGLALIMRGAVLLAERDLARKDDAAGGGSAAGGETAGAGAPAGDLATALIQIASAIGVVRDSLAAAHPAEPGGDG